VKILSALSLFLEEVDRVPLLLDRAMLRWIGAMLIIAALPPNSSIERGALDPPCDATACQGELLDPPTAGAHAVRSNCAQGRLAIASSRAHDSLCEPRKILPEEINRGGILVKGRNNMDADCAAAQSIVAAGAATNRSAPNRASTESEPTNGRSAHRNENADGQSPKRKETDREPAKGKEAARQSSEGDPASSNVT
jgi:hypothetical protein